LPLSSSDLSSVVWSCVPLFIWPISQPCLATSSMLLGVVLGVVLSGHLTSHVFRQSSSYAMESLLILSVHS
jgi:hypothetical protein